MAYIPKEHQKYDILPFCRSDGGEVFSYDSELEDEICELLPAAEMGVDEIIPYGFDSYEEYDQHLDSYIAQYGTTDGQLNRLGRLIAKFKADIKCRNIKENWSIVKYVGESTGGVGGFTHGRYYYWPCSIEKPEYEGIIDDQEFTAYFAWVNKGKITQTLDNGEVTVFVERKSDWIIIEDPTSMAARFLGESE